MSKKKKNVIDIPIIKGDKDICRLLFRKKEEGKYDIKIDFRGNNFEVNTYRLFALMPITWNIKNPQKVNMSYHNGEYGYPVLIHLKDESREGADKYRRLPATRIQPPNTNQMFPIPLFKMEIPDSVFNSSILYNRKNYHHPIELKNSNVLEFYMASELFELDEYFNKRYGSFMFSQLALSIEYFSSGTVLSDYEKSLHFISQGEPEEKFLCIGGLNGMNLFVCKYTVPGLRHQWKDIHITFIENELAEEMLFCTKVAFPKVNTVPGEYDRIYLGGATLEQLKPPDGPLKKIPPMPNTTVMRLLQSNVFSEEEKRMLSDRAGAARYKLYHEMKNFENNLSVQKNYLLDKAHEFLVKLATLQGVNYFNEEVNRWVKTDEDDKSEAIHILFARYIGLKEFGMVRYLIQGKQYRKKRIVPHIILLIDDMLEIDIQRASLNKFLYRSGESEPQIFLDRNHPYFGDDEWGGVKQRLDQCGYNCSSPQFAYYDEDKLKEIYSMDSDYLEKIYQAICMN